MDKAADSYGVIILHRDYVSFAARGDFGDINGSEPLRGHPRQTRDKAVGKIMQIFAMNGVSEHECIDARKD